VKVLFVCLGNICRSPTAEGVFRRALEQAGLADKVEIDSCGVGSWHVGKAPDARAQQAALLRGIDLSDLCARQLTEQDFNDFDYVLGMDQDNLRAMRDLKPANSQAHVGLFLDFAGTPGAEVPDPYYGGDEGFENVLNMIEAASEGLIQQLKVGAEVVTLNLQANVDLTHANTLRLPCQATHFAAPATLSELRAVLAHAHHQNWPVTLLGGGSNVLLPDKLSGVAVRPALNQWWLTRRQGSVYVHVGAGVNWHSLVMATAELGLWGIENLALIPGSCGAAPVQNIGAYGVELADTLQAVQVMELATGRSYWLSAQECAFGYRDSIFKGSLNGRVVITQLVLRLSRVPAPQLDYGDLAARLSHTPTPWEVAEAVCAIRREKLPDPEVLANAGSYFKNPLIKDAQAAQLLREYPAMPHFPLKDGHTKLAAGWLIDQCGLKGMRDGAFGVHQHQALVLVHFGGGDRQGLMNTASYIAAQVETRFGVRLESEPRLINA